MALYYMVMIYMFNNISSCINTIDRPKNKIKPTIAPRNTFIMSNILILIYPDTFLWYLCHYNNQASN